MNFGKSVITSFKQRGMETDKHDFSYLQFNNYYFAGGRLTATFADRLFEVYGGGYRIGSELDKVLDQNRNTILEIQDSPKWRSKVYGLGVRGDLTDDYYDPRRGVRLDVSRWWSPPARSSDPDFFRIEYNAAAYLPLGKRSTRVFNYFRSDAHVLRKGETDRAAVEQQQGLNCSTITDQRQQEDCVHVVDNIIAANTFGTATGLGGTSRMRSYPNERFSGAHTLFYGTEVRWTLTEEACPFDIFIAKDVRTLLQVAAFYEIGSAADLRENLGDTYRSSYVWRRFQDGDGLRTGDPGGRCDGKRGHRDDDHHRVSLGVVLMEKNPGSMATWTCQNDSNPRKNIWTLKKRINV